MRNGYLMISMLLLKAVFRNLFVLSNVISLLCYYYTIDVNNKSTPCEVPNRILASGFFNSSAQQIINCQDDNITYSIVFSTTVESANVLILFII